MKTSNGINPKIFRAYDIRGVYKKEINEDIFYILGRTFASYLKKGNVVVGRDIRQSSGSLSESFIKGVLDYGLDVLNIGNATTPMLYFAVTHLNGAGGAMITASHNPLDCNGLKFTDAEAQPIGGKEMGEFLKKSKLKSAEKKGKEKHIDVSGDYLNLITKNFKINRKIQMNIDAKNSAAGLFLEKFLKKLKIEIYSGADADFSASFDPDGDRLKTFDENQNEIRGDIIGGIIANMFLKRGDLFIYDLTSTRALGNFFEKKGIRTAISSVGHFYIKKAMKEKNAVFASEISGHYYFKFLNYVESALFALRMVLEAMDKNPNSKISDLAKPFLIYHHSDEINLPFSSKERWQEILKNLKEKYKDGKQNFEDGILIEYTDPAAGGAGWWFNLRQSNTEPVMRLVVEAKTKALLEEKRKEIIDFL